MFLVKGKWPKLFVSMLWQLFLANMAGKKSSYFEGKNVDNIEELWDRVRLLALLWASFSKEFHDSSFFFIHLKAGRVF